MTGYDKKAARLARLAKLAKQLAKYAHRWSESPSQRMLNWVDEYEALRAELQREGMWKIYCEHVGYSRDHDAYDHLA